MEPVNGKLSLQTLTEPSFGTLSKLLWKLYRSLVELLSVSLSDLSWNSLGTSSGTQVEKL